MKNKIPEPVIQKAKGLINLYGNSIEYLGKHQGCDVYKFVFPKNTETGFPFAYLYNASNGKVIEITGSQALRLIDEFKNR